MGWSIDTIRGDLDAIFRGLEKKYKIQHVESTQASVMISFEGDMPPPNVIKNIVASFPDFVYVNFVPNSTLLEVEDQAELH